MYLLMFLLMFFIIMFLLLLQPSKRCFSEKKSNLYFSKKRLIFQFSKLLQPPLKSIDEAKKKNLMFYTLIESKKKLNIKIDSNFKKTQLQTIKNVIVIISFSFSTTSQIKNKCNIFKKKLQKLTIHL